MKTRPRVVNKVHISTLSSSRLSPNRRLEHPSYKEREGGGETVGPEFLHLNRDGHRSLLFRLFVSPPLYFVLHSPNPVLLLGLEGQGPRISRYVGEGKGVASMGHLFREQDGVSLVEVTDNKRWVSQG